MAKLLMTAGAVVDQEVIQDIVINRHMDLLNFVLDNCNDPTQLSLWTLGSLLSWIGNTLDTGSRFNDQMTYLTQVHDMIHRVLDLMRTSDQTLPEEAIFSFLGRGHHSLNPHSDQIITLRKIFDQLIQFPGTDLNTMSSSRDGRKYSLLTRCFLCHNYYFAIQLLKKGIILVDLTGYRFETQGTSPLKMLYLSGFRDFPIDFESSAHPVNPLAINDVGNNYISWENNVQAFRHFVSWFRSKRYQPLTLKEMSRIRIRASFGQHLRAILRDLDIPRDLKPYLLFQEQ